MKYRLWEINYTYKVTVMTKIDSCNVWWRKIKAK